MTAKSRLKKGRKKSKNVFRVAIESRSHMMGYFENAKSGKEDESHIREGVRGGRIILTLGRNCMM